MRVGKFQPKGGEDVNFRNAEELFETRSAVEIRDVEAQTRKEIEAKKEELRQLVGASYRDLIDSADSILQMKKSCELVTENIQKMEEGFQFLKRNVTTVPASFEEDRDRKTREKLYGVGSRVKYIVDTPEKIWGCLDEHLYLEGSERYLRAREVHTLLTETTEKNEKKELLSNFPLLRHQWPLVETFRTQISQRSRDRLQESGLKVEDYAVALAAVAVIEELSSSQVFSLFLDSRKLWLKGYLRAAVASRVKLGRERATESGEPIGIELGASEGIKDEHSIAFIFCKLVGMIQSSLWHTGELFLEVSNGKQLPLLFSTILTAPPSTQLFGGIPDPEGEVCLWKVHREKMENLMTLLPGKFIAESCLSWLNACAEEIYSEGKLLVDSIDSSKELAEIETYVRGDINKQTALSGSLDWLKGAFGQAVSLPWEFLSELLLQQPTNLWDIVFENMFVRRAKDVINKGFQEVQIRQIIQEHLQVLEQSFSAHLSSPTAELNNAIKSTFKSKSDRDFSEGFRSIFKDSKSLTRPRLLRGNIRSTWQFTSDDREWLGSSTSNQSSDVTTIKDNIDQSFRAILEDLVNFLQGPQSVSRKEELAPYLQQQCFSCMSTIVKDVEESLKLLAESLKQASNFFAGTSGENADAILKKKLDVYVTVEKALLLGRLSIFLGENSSSLPLILGPSKLWDIKDKATISRSSSSVMNRLSWLEGKQSPLEVRGRWWGKRWNDWASGEKPDQGTSMLRDLQERLRNQSIIAHTMWISWSMEELSKSLWKELLKDECLSTTVSLKGWEETILKQEEEGGIEVEVKMSLPAMTSPYVVAFLFSGCQEIYRVGGHAVDKVVLQLFAWKLLDKVLKGYEDLLSSSSLLEGRISEKGLLQLLFDVRFLVDVMSGGQGSVLDNSKLIDDNKFALSILTIKWDQQEIQGKVLTQGQEHRITNLLSNMSSRLDPIDWATYEPHLWENERRSYQRSAVLFGFFTQLNRMYIDTAPRFVSNADTNTLSMSATVPRFTYLPISAPNLSISGPLSSVSRTNNLREGSPWNAYVINEDSSKYKFEEASSPSSAIGARPLLKSLMGQVGSRFGEGTFRLGSMISDGQVGKLKDKSAAAISTFGEMLPAQAAGLLSSLTASATKLENYDTWRVP
ncbi:hypothetical protein O6H91_13G005300 [Diphasiastrum complanatum]|uniref:Uncharacterized protein n=2 Tax=Diphasiastrum complanatum TaxID=34168 RepID=A0ACC2BSI8_DIPCM|nr:hypothetical protein O6H91_13G005300 [Diphasiastrum complanatum]KAJ7532480.1 hypothetical protein O6H91_13G005300 [Diphasiastrum complanatum]